MNTYFLRDVSSFDIEDIFKLSSLLNTLNLPANESELKKVITNSELSFSQQETDIQQRSFLFVLCDQSNRVFGTSQIFAKHGTLSSPHLYFQVDHDERYSETLKKFFRHRTLRLMQNFDGPTEIGSLVLHNSLRSSPHKLGTMLSYVRFLFMAMRPHYFASGVLAELLPPLGANFESSLWNAVGHKFTGLSYYEADMISRTNKEFIKTLFPTCEIYASLLPKNAQDVIGQVGPQSKGAAHLLSKIGFRYSNRVDPFDGGPHFEADLTSISLIREASRGRLIIDNTREYMTHGLIGRYTPKSESGNRFRASMSAFMANKEVIYAPPATAALLDAKDGDEVSVIPASAPGQALF